MAEVRTRPEKDGGDSRNVHDVLDENGNLIDTYDSHAEAQAHADLASESEAAAKQQKAAELAAEPADPNLDKAEN